MYRFPNPDISRAGRGGAAHGGAAGRGGADGSVRPGVNRSYSLQIIEQPFRTILQKHKQSISPL